MENPTAIPEAKGVQPRCSFLREICSDGGKPPCKQNRKSQHPLYISHWSSIR